jgi:radical SAM protein with 4Fe4S-binding SPASM domain
MPEGPSTPSLRSARELGLRWRTRTQLVATLAQTWWRRPASPTRVVLDLTRRCNLRCAMCRTWARPASRELSAAEIGRVLGSMRELCWLDLTGGEPFVRRDIGDVFAAVVDNVPRLAMLHFQTNGWLAPRVATQTRRLRERLHRGAELIVTVSIDGPAALHDEIRGKPGSYDRAIEAARALRGIDGVDVHIGTTLTARNHEAMNATWSALQRDIPGLARTHWHMNAMQTSAHFYGNASAHELRAPVAAPLERHLVARGIPTTLAEAVESVYLLNVAFVQRGEPSKIGCQALRSTMFISPEGDVYPCHIYDRPLGNVRERDVLEIWASTAVADARRDIEALACGGCFSACEAYPAIAGAPLTTLRVTAKRAATLLREKWTKGA